MGQYTNALSGVANTLQHCLSYYKGVILDRPTIIIHNEVVSNNNWNLKRHSLYDVQIELDDAVLNKSCREMKY